MKNSNENNIIFYDAWWHLLRSKTPSFRISVLDAVFRYAFEGESASFPTESGEQIAYETMTAFIDSNRAIYSQKVAQSQERWQRKKDSLAHTGNALPAGNALHAHSVDKDKDNVKDKDNTSKKEDKSFFSPDNNSCANAQEKEKNIFDYALFLLAEGRSGAYAAAVKAYDYNEALGWMRETERKDGSVVRQPVKQRLAWLKNSPDKPPQEFDAPHGELLATILHRVGMRPESADIVNLFRGIAFRGSELCFLYTRLSSPVKAFAAAITSSPRVHNIVVEEVAKRYPTTESVNILPYSQIVK